MDVLEQTGIEQLSLREQVNEFVLNPQTEYTNAVASLADFRKDFGNKVQSIYKYFTKPYIFPKVLLTPRGLACLGYAYNEASDEDRVSQRRAEEIEELLWEHGIHEDLAFSVIDIYFRNLSQTDRLYWNSEFSWDIYDKDGGKVYDTSTTENEKKREKVPETQKKRKKRRTSPQTQLKIKWKAEITRIFNKYPNKKFSARVIYERPELQELWNIRSYETVKGWIEELVRDTILVPAGRGWKPCPNSEHERNYFNLYQWNPKNKPI